MTKDTTQPMEELDEILNEAVKPKLKRDVQAYILELIGEDEDVWHETPYGQGLNVDGYDGNIRNQFRAKLRAQLNPNPDRKKVDV